MTAAAPVGPPDRAQLVRQLATTDELAQAYIFLMGSGFITGQHIAVDGDVMLGA